VWGDTRAEAEQANEDTFHYTNAAPQAAKFNQGIELWLGLESYLQQNAADNSRRIVVFTGPIFGPTDPAYRGVDIPLKFFKVAAFLQAGKLAATGYVVDQTPSLADLPDIPRPGSPTKPRHSDRSGRSRSPSGTSPPSPDWAWTSSWQWTGCRSRQPCPAPGSPKPGANCAPPKTSTWTSTWATRTTYSSSGSCDQRKGLRSPRLLEQLDAGFAPNDAALHGVP
jgi:hypothetical protein